MSRRGNCWDNAPQESFFGHMKDHIMDKIASAESFDDAKAIIDDYMDFYNNDNGIWELAKLTPNEYYEYCLTGIYPLLKHNQDQPDPCWTVDWLPDGIMNSDFVKPASHRLRGFGLDKISAHDAW